MADPLDISTLPPDPIAAGLIDPGVYVRKAEKAAAAKASKASPPSEAREKPESFADIAKTAAENIGKGFIGAITAPVQLAAAAAGADEMREAFSGEAAARGAAFLAGRAGGQTEEQAQESAAEYEAAARARGEANPGAAFAGRMGGQILGLAAGGVGALGAKAGTGATAALGGGLGARLAGAAARGAIESLPVGVDVANEEAFAAERRLTGQQVLAQAGLMAVLGGGVSFGVKGLGELMTAGASATKRAASSAIERVAGGAEEATEHGAERTIRKAIMSGDDDAVRQVYRVTSGEEASERMPGLYREMLDGKDPRPQILESATKDLYESTTTIEGSLDKITAEVREKPLKLANVEANFEKSRPPPGTLAKAKQAALETWNEVQALRGEIAEQVQASLVNGGLEAKAAARKAANAAAAFTGLQSEMSAGVKAIASTGNAAEAYVAADQMRRQLLASLDAVGASATRTTDPMMSRILRDATERLNGTYQKAANHLFDESVWGAQGAAQKATNEAWVGWINARQNAFKGFADKVGDRLMPSGLKVPVYDMNEASLARMVDEMRGPAAKVARRRFEQYLTSTDRLANSIGKGYELSGEKSASLDALNAGLQKIRSTFASVASDTEALGQAERLIAAGQHEGVIEGAGAKVAAGVGAGLGGLLGGLGGAAVGGYAAKTAGEMAFASPARLMAKRIELETVARRAHKELTQAMGGFFGKIRNASGKARAVSVAPLARQAAVLTPLQHLAGKDRSPEDGYRRVASDVIAANQDNGRAVREAVARTIGNIATDDPHAATAMVVSATKAVQYLQQKLPTAQINTHSLTPMTSRPVPSRTDLEEFARIYQTLDKPVQTLSHDLQTGTLSRAQVAAIKAVHPELYEWMRATAASEIRELDAAGIEIPFRQAQQLDVLLDLNGAGERTLEDDFALMYGVGISASTKDRKPPPPRRGPMKLAATEQTGTARLLGG